MNHVPHICIIGDSLKPGSYKRYASFRRIDNFVNSAGAIIALTDDESLLAPYAIIVDKFHTEKYTEIIIHPNSTSLNNPQLVGVTPYHEITPNDKKGMHQARIPRHMITPHQRNNPYDDITPHVENGIHHGNTTNHTKTQYQENPIYQIESISMYDSGFVWPDIDVAQMQYTIQTFLTRHADLFPRESLLSLLLPSPLVNSRDNLTSAFDRVAFTAFEHAFSLLYVHFFDSISAFRGKGRGLTPSGDDFIAGLLYGIHCIESLTNKNHLLIKTNTYELAAGNNLFSNNMLQLARDARYFKRLKDFLNALVHQNPQKTITAFQHLITVGHTSGADLIAGFFALILQKPLIFDQHNPC